MGFLYNLMVVNSFHAQSIENILKEFSSKKNGLSKKDVAVKLEKYGKNELVEKKKINPFFIVLAQFKSFLVYILIFAAVISFLI